MDKRTPVMEGKNITVRFGDGCSYCRSHPELEKGRCPVCHTIWGVRDVVTVKQNWASFGK